MPWASAPLKSTWVSEWVRVQLCWAHTVEKQKHSKTMLKSGPRKPNSFLGAATQTALGKAVGDISQLDTIGFKRFILKPRVIMPQ